MEHRPLSELSSIADLKIPETVKVPVLSKRERLDRWIELLETGGTSWSGITFKAIYLTTNVDGELGADSFTADDWDIRQYGIGAEYEMANGVGVAGFWRRIDGDSVAGFDHEADVYGIGASYDLGGGAEVKGGIVQLDGTSPFYGGDFDRTSADFGLSLTF